MFASTGSLQAPAGLGRYDPRSFALAAGICDVTAPDTLPVVLVVDDEPELRALLAKLGIPARELLRTSEAAYRERGLADAGLPEAALIRAMCEEPRLMQRPVVVRGARAVVARPATRALELLA